MFVTKGTKHLIISLCDVHSHEYGNYKKKKMLCGIKVRNFFKCSFVLSLFRCLHISLDGTISY